MKKLLTTIVAVAITGTATAGRTEFNWAGGTAGTAVAGDVVTTFAGYDLSAFTAPMIDIADLTGWIDQQSAVIAPPFAGGTWGTLAISDPTSDRVGMSVIAIIDDNGIFECGEFINISSIAGPLAELDTSPPGTPCSFSPGSVTIGAQLCPEPATGGLMVLVSGGIFFARRRFVI